jgi:hypothetical protein
LTFVDEAVALLDEALARCGSASVWAWPDSTVVGCLDRLQALSQQVAALQLALIREVEGRGIAVSQGATSTAAWLRDRHRISAGAAARQVKLATALHADLPATADALAIGTINVEQTRVISEAVAKLPVEHRPAGEEHLLGEAKVFGPRELAILGQRLFEVVAPDEAEARALAELARAEERAYQGRDLQLADLPGESRVRLTGWLDRESAARVRAALDPLCAPRTAHRTQRDPHGQPTGHDTARVDAAGVDAAGVDAAGVDAAGVDAAGVDLRTPGQRRADALVEICQLALACGELPDNGGDRPQVVVTVDLDTLRSQIGTATLDDGAPLSAATARRIACDATIIPAVLDGPSQALDVGREQRLFTAARRRALILRDNGCAFPGCERPPRWCDGHHITHWADGGRTDPDNGVLLCGHHHRVVHHGEWQVRLNPRDRKPEFIPPEYIDPHRRPLRNNYHRRE